MHKSRLRSYKDSRLRKPDVIRWLIRFPRQRGVMIQARKSPISARRFFNFSLPEHPLSPHFLRDFPRAFCSSFDTSKDIENYTACEKSNLNPITSTPPTTPHTHPFFTPLGTFSSGHLSARFSSQPVRLTFWNYIVYDYLIFHSKFIKINPWLYLYSYSYFNFYVHI